MENRRGKKKKGVTGKASWPQLMACHERTVKKNLQYQLGEEEGERKDMAFNAKLTHGVPPENNTGTLTNVGGRKKRPKEPHRERKETVPTRVV